MNHIFLSGPESDQDKDGDEIPVWFVYVGDDQAEPVSRTYKVHNLKRARALAAAMRRDRMLPVIDEAWPA